MTAASIQPLRPSRRSIKVNDGSEKVKADPKHVSFSSLEIYEFLIMIGDNPSCEGAPLCISDNCQMLKKLDVNEFEANRDKRKSRKQMVLSATKRSRLLMSLGYTMEDIATAALETQKVRQEREESLGSQKWDKFQFVLESATRKFKKMVGKAPKPPSTQSTVVSRSA
eukprot:Nitzschia sp. Nitz4//scaffold36_size144017//47870//48475//NITZ4_003080-RA/size144017-snap-gene-0.208-mRNA-1//-1//CDS//3329549438//245//frame0